MNKIELVKKIHTTPSKVVLAIAGGGSEAIGEILRHGQGSNTILEAVVPYCQRAYEEFIGGPPDKFVSEEAAAQLAMAAWQRAVHLEGTPVGVLGIGATCALAKENERAGREHRVWIARQSHDHCSTLGFNVNSHREEEETIVSDCILNEIAMGSGILNDIPNITQPFDVSGHEYVVPPHITQLYNGEVNACSISNGPTTPGGKLILSGSFNPFHNGHLLMAKIARELCPTAWRADDKVHFELSVRNVDKPWLTYKAVVERSNDWLMNKQDWCGDLWFTNAPRFIDKSQIFREAVFVVGFDTFARVNDQKYYKTPEEMSEKFDTFRKNGVKWIVFPRKKADGTISTTKDVEDLCWKWGSWMRESVLIVPNDKYPEEIHGVSSSNIRNGK